MLTIRAMTDGKGYSARHLEHSDYYAEGERVKGQWRGRGAELLGLKGDVRQEEFEALREGVDPETGTFLRQRQSADRTGPDGQVQSHGRHLYDFTISAPKSVSIMAIVGGDSRLIEAHQRAVGVALQELEKHAATRVRMDGANADRITGNLAIAVYHHDTSRELDPQLHAHGDEIATAESLRRERDMIDRVNRGIGRCDRLGGVEKFIASDRLRPEQKRVVEFVLDSRDRVVAISGAAGTGKTATLQELRRGLLEAQREVLAVAPTMSAVEELQKVGFADAITVERFLQDRGTQQGLRQKVVVLDEAGMVSGRQMSEFLRLAEAGGARVVFSGDTRQIQSVEACDALRILEKESRLKGIALTQVQRQTQLDYRDAVQELRRDPERGFEKLDAMGAVREVAPADRAAEVARQYSAAVREHSSVLVVCATHDEIERVTSAMPCWILATTSSCLSSNIFS